MGWTPRHSLFWAKDTETPDGSPSQSAMYPISIVGAPWVDVKLREGTGRFLLRRLIVSLILNLVDHLSGKMLRISKPKITITINNYVGQPPSVTTVPSHSNTAGGDNSNSPSTYHWQWTPAGAHTKDMPASCPRAQAIPEATRRSHKQNNGKTPPNSNMQPTPPQSHPRNRNDHPQRRSASPGHHASTTIRIRTSKPSKKGNAHSTDPRPKPVTPHIITPFPTGRPDTPVPQPPVSIRSSKSNRAHLTSPIPNIAIQPPTPARASEKPSPSPTPESKPETPKPLKTVTPIQSPTLKRKPSARHLKCTNPDDKVSSTHSLSDSKPDNNKPLPSPPSASVRSTTYAHPVPIPPHIYQGSDTLAPIGVPIPPGSWSSGETITPDHPKPAERVQKPCSPATTGPRPQTNGPYISPIKFETSTSTNPPRHTTSKHEMPERSSPKKTSSDTSSISSLSTDQAEESAAWGVNPPTVHIAHRVNVSPNSTRQTPSHHGDPAVEDPLDIDDIYVPLEESRSGSDKSPKFLLPLLRFLLEAAPEALPGAFTANIHIVVLEDHAELAIAIGTEVTRPGGDMATTAKITMMTCTVQVTSTRKIATARKEILGIEEM
ncbi:hypothetical protein CVT24_009017 [Panaeolus cyanescens]|uniref:Uncharacterized protein n=1 Tax=Panaeolus cyanescens TaxID=181874 RepID=A0A409YAP0_9AGAR|nr:hypothetical protein CVT24_009017 [Panaeolus cyanescens]